MDIFDFYRDTTQHSELKRLYVKASQEHKDNLGEAFIEKDIWVTEILRLLFDEGLLGDKTVAFKGGTALSKRWKAIERFSEDIDLSIHWHDMLDQPESEEKEWEKTTKSGAQSKKFREAQSKRLEEWTKAFSERLQTRLDEYNIDGLSVHYRNAETIEVLYPAVTDRQVDQYYLGPVLLEFGARNRGEPTQSSKLTTYFSEIAEISGALSLPVANDVKVFEPGYIIWEKLTALHQFCTSTKPPKAARLARHWYDVDCMINNSVVDPVAATQAMTDVVEMKKARWPEKGVDYNLASTGGLVLLPSEPLREQVSLDYKQMIEGGMYFHQPDDFINILKRLEALQKRINDVFSNQRE